MRPRLLSTYARRVAGPPDRLAVVKGGPATRRAYVDRSLGRERRRRPLAGDPHSPALRAETHHLCIGAGPRREALSTDMEGLEQVRLAGAVRARDEDDPGLQLELEPGVGAEIAKRQLADGEPAGGRVTGAQPASRIGMMRYQKLSSCAAISPGLSGLIRRSCTVSPATASSPSRRKSGLKPISIGSPAYSIPSDSRASPTSWVCAETESSPSANRSRSGELRCAMTDARRTTSRSGARGVVTSASKLSGRSWL